MRAALLCLLLTVSTTLLAQSPQLLVSDKPGDKPHPISLAKANIGVQINGRLAMTSMTLTFANDANRVLEGELVFPLPEGATVCGYALDVGGQLVDAVVVEKEKARVVFETEVRKGIDPGIVEKVSGNNFRTRIYPIPANGTRTVRVQYVSELSGDGKALNFALPLKWDKPVKSASVDVQVVNASDAKATGLEGVALSKAGEGMEARAKLTDANLATTLAVSVPVTEAPQIAVEKRTRVPVSVENLDPKVAAEFEKVEHYFLVDLLPPAMPANGAGNISKGRVLVAWDASMSRAETDHTREFALIEKSVGERGADLLVFRNTAETVVSFANAKELITHLKNLIYDGGTALSDLKLLKNETGYFPDRRYIRAPESYAFALLFTDGLSNLGGEMPGAVELPTYAVGADAKSNHAVLRRISSESGAQYLNLARMTDNAAIAAIGIAPYSLLSIDAKPEEVAEIYPRGVQPVQGRMVISGKLLADSATITLNFGLPGQPSQRIPVTIKRDGASSTGLVPRYWAQMKLADLSVMEEKNQPDIVALGKEFSLVTAHTSMIVLESVEQYLQHKIVPPKSRGDVYATFMKRIEEQRGQEVAVEKAKIDRVVAMWNARVKWWEQDFKYAADFRYKEAEGKKDQAALTDADPRPMVHSPEPNRPANQADIANATVDALLDAQSNRGGRPMREGGGQQGQARANGPGGGGGLFGGGGGGGGGNGHPTGEVRRLEERLYREDRNIDGTVALKGENANTGKGAAAAIAIKEWSPNTPYLKALKAAKPEDAYAIYSDQSKTLRSSPAFYLDCADFFAKSNPDLAVRILTNIPELGLDDGRLLRIAAHRLAQLGRLDLAVDLFEKVAKLRPEEPQSFRDLALVLADRAAKFATAGDKDRSRSDYQRSLDLLHKVVMNQWDRFEEIEVIALMEANQILTQSAIRIPQSAIHNPFDSRLVKLLDVDLRILLTWDTDNTDVDLHVLEPSGEICFYGHNRTTIGGAMSKDFTQGYGPEEYVLRKLMPGQYTVKCHFYGNRDQKMVGPTTVQATIITNFGRPDEKRESLTLRLAEAKDMVEIGKVTLKP